METIKTQLTKIAHEMHQAEQHLAAIQARMTEIEKAGMYPSVPARRWIDDQYLYLFFRAGEPSAGLQLDAKGRLYIGSDPARIAGARQMIERRRQWEVLQSTAESLDRWLRNKTRAIMEMTQEAERWPRMAEQFIGDQPGREVPK